MLLSVKTTVAKLHFFSAVLSSVATLELHFFSGLVIVSHFDWVKVFSLIYNYLRNHFLESAVSTAWNPLHGKYQGLRNHFEFAVQNVTKFGNVHCPFLGLENGKN